MDESKHTCNHCDGEITEYFDERYNGTRGRCPVCETDFPLE
ncbi:MAG: hypothetical protein ACE5GR_01000 [Nitrosopumilus sp.]